MPDARPSPDETSPDRRPQGDGEERTWAGNVPLDRRWWWSPALMVVVGIAVAAYQYSVIADGTAIALTWVMVAIGAVVTVAGLVQLKRAWDVEQVRRRGETAGT
ncbi:hypothetical protein GXB85_07240 [Cellulomonas sp. APG4]|uniref:hypothetical protein n=1 Tax=Cellulomonas sp. APG4 TaxID=1538656 RepID=UPI001379686A|nr:hypothetical protein [Cellulomonas sp. APG4]NCT90739.1 hypothetical protein [Cellulomonas sp. APG4]